MIFFFTGTGNSLHAAKTIADAQKDKLLSIPEEMDKAGNSFTYHFKNNELLGFVFPVYAWAPPKIVLDFINEMKITGGKPFIFSLNTCGEEEGKTTHMLQRALDEKGFTLNSAFSIKMPNNYVVGSDVYPKEREDKILSDADKKLANFNRMIYKRQSDVFQLLPGKLPGLKTAIVNQLFNRFAINTKQFYATDACNKCKICEKHCPVHTIKVDEKPVWGKACTQCLACINRCPVRAIQFGKATEKRGRFVHPALK